MATPLGRRSLLLGALGLAASGCTLGRAKGINAASAACSDVATMPIYVPLATNKEAAAFEAFDPVLYPLPSSDQYSCSTTASGAKMCYPSHAARWSIGTASGWNVPTRYYALDAALHAANLDPTTLLPDTLAGFQYQGDTWGLPASVAPIGVAYRPDVFAAARLKTPAPDWTLADFETACDQILGLTKAGKIPGCYGPLPPMIGSSTYTLTYGQSTSSFTAYGSLLDPALWTGFVPGYGGSLVQGGRFDLTNPGAVRGFTELVRICGAYGAPSTLLPTTQAQAATYLNGAAMLFWQYSGPPSGAAPAAAARAATQRKYARFPVLPVAPTVPAALSGWWLPGDPGMISAPGTAMNAVVQFALWSYQRVRHDPAAPGPPPILSAPDVQRAYWQAPAQVSAGASAMGDYVHYAYIDQGYPPVFTSTAGIIYDALSPAVAGATDVASALATATQKVNADAAQYRTDKLMQAQAQLQRASTYGQFGGSVKQPGPPSGPVVRICRK